MKIIEKVILKKKMNKKILKNKKIREENGEDKK